jgi:uncharacterized metal-binding protein YceD (DUF177 family)
MTKLARSAITGRVIPFSVEADLSSYPLSYPLLGIKKCHYEAKVSKVGDYAHASYHIEATLLLADSRDNSPFTDNVTLDEDVDLLEEEDEVGEGYVVPGTSIDLDEIAYKIIASSLPISVSRHKSSLPKNGKGYRVLTEEEAAKEKESAYNPAFDKLKDFDTK